ncbi:hypothetical protein EAI_05689, partial [Harpegnathos saltator]
FMIDSGSAVNLIQRHLLEPGVHVNNNVQLTLQSISPKPITTMECVQITFLGKLANFHVLPDEFPFEEHEILGNEFFK